MPWGEHRFLSVFLDSDLGETSVEGCEYADRISAGRTDENAEKVRKIANED
jgi:hypothetical protein